VIQAVGARREALVGADRRAEILERFVTAIGRPIDAPQTDGDPAFPVEVLEALDAVDRVQNVLRWIVEEADASAVSA
jgi:hypothetical protein